MLEGSVYGVTALVSALVCLAILKCSKGIYDNNNVPGRYFSLMLVMCVAYDLFDALWGIMADGTVNLGRTCFNVVTFIICFLGLFTVACWCIFLTGYLGIEEDRRKMIFQSVPLAAGLLILITQITGHTIYFIDADLVFYIGPFRKLIFVIRLIYLLIPVATVLYLSVKNRGANDRRYLVLVTGCTLIPVVFEALQILYPYAPYSVLGILASVVYLFNGMMVIEKINNSQKYETISKEMYMALEALSDSYASILMIDIKSGETVVIKSDPYLESLLENDVPIRDNILRIFSEVADSEYAEEVADFADINLLPDKMANRRSISDTYHSDSIGWCTATYIAAERDPERNLRKVLLAVRSVDEQKKKEKEYEDALSRAYRNENTLLAELIKMQSVGLVAVDDKFNIIEANDAVLEMFGNTGKDPIGRNVYDFFGGKDLKHTEEVEKLYEDVRNEGISGTYQLVVNPDGREGVTRYLMGDVKRVDLLDNTKIVVTCYTDITNGKILEDKLRILSETDALTGIANRRCGESQIKLLLGERVPGIYCLFDVNGFKQINDTYGHQTGDDTLVAVARAVRASFRDEDIFMRLGGDEFAIYMRNVVTADLAKIRIARLFENIARIELENVPKGSVTISLGAVIVTNEEGEDMPGYESIYKRADARMYKCKNRPGSNMSIEEPNE